MKYYNFHIYWTPSAFIGVLKKKVLGLLLNTLLDTIFLMKS